MDKLTPYEKLQFLRRHVPKICIHEHTANGHIDALYWLYRMATDKRLDPLVRQAAERIFDLVEDGNYDAALEHEVLSKQVGELRARLGYDVDVHSDYAEAGD